MKDATNDNEPLSFITLAAATANVTRYLTGEKQKKECKRDTAHERTEKDDPEDDADYIEHRLKELAALERSLNKKRGSY